MFLCVILFSICIYGKVTAQYDYNTPARINPGRESANHGDIFTGDDLRYVNAEIAYYDADLSKITFIPNPDDSGSGYLTIPSEILQNIDDARNKYKVLFDEGVPSFNMYISSRDAFIIENLGDTREEYEFNIFYTFGELESVYIRPKDSENDWQEFEVPLNWDTIEKYFMRRNGELSKFGIQVNLLGADLTRYKDLHAVEGKKYSWLNAQPSLPSGWIVEKGSSGMTKDSYHFVWKLSGPAVTEQQAKENVKNFFDGFDMKFL